MGNLQSDEKKRNKKMCIQGAPACITFERVHTPGKRQAPPPPSQINITHCSIVSSSENSEIQNEENKLQLQSHNPTDVSLEFTSGCEFHLLRDDLLPSPVRQSCKPFSSTINECAIVPPLGMLPAPTMGPPLLVTDSWRRANTNFTISSSDILTPPSKESSSDSVFTDPEETIMISDIRDISSHQNQTTTTTTTIITSIPTETTTLVKNNKFHQQSEIKKIRNKHFIITPHNNIQFNFTNQIPTSTPQSITPYRRHSAVDQTSNDNTVLRHVASVTLDNASHDTRKHLSCSNISTPKFPSQRVEKFKGRHLVNLFTSTIPERVRNQLSDEDLNKFAAAFYTQLQILGIIKVYDDETSIKETFTTDQFYYWTTPLLPPKTLNENRNNNHILYPIEYVRHLKSIITNLRSEVERLQKSTDDLIHKNKVNNGDDVMKSQGSSSRSRDDENSPMSCNKNGMFIESERFAVSSLDISPISQNSSGDKSKDEFLTISTIVTPISETGINHDYMKYKVIPTATNIHKVLKVESISHISDRKIHDKQDSINQVHEFKCGGGNISEECNRVIILADSRKKMNYVPESSINKINLVESSNCEKKVSDIHVQNVYYNDSKMKPEESQHSIKDTLVQEFSRTPLPLSSSSPPPTSLSNEFKHSSISIANIYNLDRPSVPPPPPPPPPLPHDGTSISLSSCLTPENSVAAVPPPPPPPSLSLMLDTNKVPIPPPMPEIIGLSSPPHMSVAGSPPPILIKQKTTRDPDIPPLPPPSPPLFLPRAAGSEVIPPPPPPPLNNTPAALPTPPQGGWNPPIRASMRKPPLAPEAPMKPLYWTRILIPTDTTLTIPATNPNNPPQIPLWAEIEEENHVNIKEFVDLFSRQVVDRKPIVKKEEVKKSSKIQPAKILDSKRSKTVGILEKSLRVDFSEIENAVYNLDTSILSLEALQQIYEIMPTSKEIEEITKHEQEYSDIPLDRPEMFLKQLSTIKNFNERIICLMFQSEFHDAIYSVSTKLTNLRSTCEYLCNSQPLKGVMALILTLGNYMNGGNRMRGQADGFGLEILGKLKDVKSKIPGVTLLHYVVKTKLAQEENQHFDDMLSLPVPEPADIEAASTIDFDEITKELDRLDKKLAVCRENYNLVTETCSENCKAFKEKMETFLNQANNELLSENENLQETRVKFKTVMHFYQYVPKGTTIDKADPKDFFQLWISFCKDFKDIWKNEQQRLKKEKMKNLRQKIEVTRKVETTKIVPGGLKDRLRKFMNNSRS